MEVELIPQRRAKEETAQHRCLVQEYSGIVILQARPPIRGCALPTPQFLPVTAKDRIHVEVDLTETVAEYDLGAGPNQTR